jgi:hypothetical protein
MDEALTETWRATLYRHSGRVRLYWWGPDFETLLARMREPELHDAVQAHVSAPDGRSRVFVRSENGDWTNATTSAG